MLDQNDGWHECNEEKQHYFFRGFSLCKKHVKTAEFHHDNDPARHCETCSQRLQKLMALASSPIANTFDGINGEKIIDILDRIDTSKSTMIKEAVPENVSAVLNAGTKNKKTIQPDSKKKKK